MERESIDLVGKTVADYNNELLCLVGTLSRILYENEMIQITRLYNEMIGVDIKNEKSNSFREWFKKQESTLAYSDSKSNMMDAKNNKKAKTNYYIRFKRRALYTISRFIFKQSAPNLTVEPDDERTVTI